MKSTYDATVNALYITLSDEVIVRTKEIDPGTLVDVATGGSVVGIEVLTPSRPWVAAVLEEFGDDINEVDQTMIRAMFGTPEFSAGRRTDERIPMGSAPTVRTELLADCLA